MFAAFRCLFQWRNSNSLLFGFASTLAAAAAAVLLAAAAAAAVRLHTLRRRRRRIVLFVDVAPLRLAACGGGRRVADTPTNNRPANRPTATRATRLAAFIAAVVAVASDAPSHTGNNRRCFDCPTTRRRLQLARRRRKAKTLFRVSLSLAWHSLSVSPSRSRSVSFSLRVQVTCARDSPPDVSLRRRHQLASCNSDLVPPDKRRARNCRNSN